MGIFQNNLMGAAAAAASSGGGGTPVYDYQVAKSARFQLANSSYMYRTPSSSGNRTTWTYSTWVKRTKYAINTSFFGATRSGYENVFRFEDTSGNDQLNLFGFTGSTLDFNIQTNNMYRDSSAWYHIVIAFDTTQGTSTNRIKLYVNGELQTNLKENTYPSQNYATNVNDTSTACQVGYGSYGGQYFDGYIADSILIDGTQYAASDFGETVNGVWVPKDPSGLTFGTNGFHINYASSSDLGNDISGNNNDLTVSGLAVHDSMVDTPTFNSDTKGGNMCTWNPLDKKNVAIPTEGNLSIDYDGSNYNQIRGTHSIGNSGKWYMELYKSDAYASYPAWGICDQNQKLTSSYGQPGYVGKAMVGISWDFNSEKVYKSLTYSESTAGTEIGTTGTVYTTTAQVVGMAIDLDNNKIFTHINGTWDSGCGNPSSGGSGFDASSLSGVDNLVPVIFPASYNSRNYVFVGGFGADSTFGGLVSAGSGTDTNGYGNFTYAVPTGYKAICQGNLSVAEGVDPEQTEDNIPKELFFMSEYAGNLTGRTITTENQPDWMWIRHYTQTQDWYVFDSTRVITDNKVIITNTTALESTLPQSNVTSVGSTSVGISSGSWLNSTGSTYQMWMWRANGGTTSTNTAGSANSTVQVDPSGGFSIVKWTGTSDSWGNAITLGHGLSRAPTCIIAKKYLGNSDDWTVFFSNYGSISTGGSTAAHANLVLNTDGAIYTNQSYKSWGGVMPTSSVFTVDGNNLNGASDTIIAYCFANTDGYIKSGSYVGNAAADGTFVHTGFRPAFILNKPLVAGNWRQQDILRSPFNVTQNSLTPNSTAAEDTGASVKIDILSNGFKMKDSQTPWNQATTYVYLAFAENPFKYATAR